MKRSTFALILALWLATAAAAQTDRVTLTADAPAPPARVSASYVGAGGNNTYYYWVVAIFPRGKSAIGGPGLVRNIGALSVGAPVTVAWSAETGATAYDVLRTDTASFPSSGTCTCAVATGVASTSTSDTGAALASYTISGGIPPATAAIRLDNRNYPTARIILEEPAGSLSASSYDKATFVLCNGSECAAGVNLTNEYIFVNDVEFDFCSAFAKTAPVGASLIIDVNLGGATVFSATKLVIAAGSSSGSQSNFTGSPLNASAGQRLTADIDQVGSTTPGQDVTVVCRFNVRP